MQTNHESGVCIRDCKRLRANIEYGGAKYILYTSR